MAVTVSYRDRCRLCGSRSLRRFFRHAAAPFTDDFVAASDAGTEFLHDVDVYWCADCKTAQTQHDVDVSDYYRDYGYTVSSSPFVLRFMDQVAAATCDRFGFSDGDTVIEVGSGDGAQLAAFQRRGLNVLGVEPSDSLCSASLRAGVPVVQMLFGPESVGQLPTHAVPAQALFLSYTFDHLPDPLGFLQAAREVLDPERGVLIVEVHDFEKIIDRREICLFEHEHSVYLTSLTFERLLTTAGFKLLTLDLVPQNVRRGNSLLVAAAPAGAAYAVDRVDHGAAARFECWEALTSFQEEVGASLRNLTEHVQAGGRVAGYGAGGRGVMTLAAAGLTDKDVLYLCDANPSFHGRLAPKSHVPVVSPEHAFESPVDEIVVFSFGYLQEIRESLAPLTARGARIVSMLDLLQTTAEG